MTPLQLSVCTLGLTVLLCVSNGAARPLTIVAGVEPHLAQIGNAGAVLGVTTALANLSPRVWHVEVTVAANGLYNPASGMIDDEFDGLRIRHEGLVRQLGSTAADRPRLLPPCAQRSRGRPWFGPSPASGRWRNSGRSCMPAPCASNCARTSCCGLSFSPTRSAGPVIELEGQANPFRWNRTWLPDHGVQLRLGYHFLT